MLMGLLEILFLLPIRRLEATDGEGEWLDLRMEIEVVPLSGV